MSRACAVAALLSSQPSPLCHLQPVLSASADAGFDKKLPGPAATILRFSCTANAAVTLCRQVSPHEDGTRTSSCAAASLAALLSSPGGFHSPFAVLDSPKHPGASGVITLTLYMTSSEIQCKERSRACRATAYGRQLGVRRCLCCIYPSGSR